MNTQKIIRNLLVIVLATTLFSCLESDNDLEYRIIPEAIVLKKELGDTTQYAVALYAYSNIAIATAEVDTPGGETVELTPFQNAQITFAHIPDDLEFSVYPPESGQYSFTVINTNGDELIEADNLSATSLEIPVIDSLVFHPENYTIDVYWETTTGAENYYVSITNLNGESIYTGYEVVSDSTHYKVLPTDEGWTSAPITGSDYLLVLNALSYESNADPYEYYYHVNALATSEQQFTWNP